MECQDHEQENIMVSFPTSRTLLEARANEAERRTGKFRREAAVERQKRVGAWQMLLALP